MTEPVRLNTPLTKEDVLKLKVGDRVLLSGRIITGRDTAHKWLLENFIQPQIDVDADDLHIYEKLKVLLKDSCIYHCGPIVRQDDRGNYHFVAAGPTTSMREESYQAQVIEHFGLRGVIGKGGMGADTQKALQEKGAVYLHAIGGMGAYYAQCVERVVGVYKLSFGVPEALWVIDVRDMPLLVSMDAHRRSLHEEVEGKTKARLGDLMDLGNREHRQNF